MQSISIFTYQSHVLTRTACGVKIFITEFAVQVELLPVWILTLCFDALQLVST